jgi:uncharacterized protein YqeY
MIKEAMKEKRLSGDNLRYQTLQNILEKAQRIAKDNKSDTVTDSMVTEAAKKEIKQLKDLLEYCTEGSDKYNETTRAIGYASEMLPKMATEEDIENFLNSNKDQVTNIGAAMKMLKAQFGDALDGKMASGVVKKFIG